MTATSTKPKPEFSDSMKRAMPATLDSLPEISAAPVDRLRLLWSRRRFLVRIAAWGAVVGVLVALLIPSQYQSTVQLMPPDNQPSSGILLAALARASTTGLGGTAEDLLGVKSSGDLFVGILSSRTIQDRLIQRFQLKKVYRVKLDEDARKELARNTGLGSDRKSGIITIVVTDHDAHRAQAVGQAYVEELNRLVTELSTSAAHRERVFLEERLSAVKQDLDQSSRDFGAFASKNATIDIKEQGKAMVGAAAALAGELIALESQLKGLEAIYTPNNPRVRAVQARVSELRRQLNELGGSESTASDSSANSDVTNKTPFPSIRELPVLGVTYADLYRRTKIQEVVYETLTQQYELAKVQEAKETPSVRTLDSANVPERKSFPPRTLIVFVFGCSALLLGSLWLFAHEQWHQMDPDDANKLLAMDVMRTLGRRVSWVPRVGSRVLAPARNFWNTIFGRQRHF